MKSRAWDFRILTLIGLCFTSSIGDAHGPPTTINVRTSAEIINAILAANSSDLPTVIRVAPGHYQFVESFSSEFGSSVLPPIESNITLVGRGAATTTLEGPGRGDGRIFTVVPGGRLTVRGVTITGGSLGAEVLGDDRGGGAAGNFDGFLRFQDCLITGNAAEQYTSGGAILSVNGRLQIERTTLSNNIAGNFSAGGAVALLGGSGVIRDSIISGNFSNDGPGGGVYINFRGKLGIYGSTIAGNTAGSLINDSVAEGGGIFNSGTVWLANSAVVENVTGGHSNFAGAGSGGGISNYGIMSIKNGTVVGNTGATSGGGIYNKGSLHLQGVTVARNEAESLVESAGDVIYPRGCFPRDDMPEGLALCASGGGGIWNEPTANISIVRSVIAGNVIRPDAPGSFGLVSGPDCAGTLRSLGHNAIGDGAGCKLAGSNTHDLIDVDPRLAAELVDNGEPGNAHLQLRNDSPLIDVGGIVGQFCTFLDQIGQRRIDGDQDGNVDCDIGAIEVQP